MLNYQPKYCINVSFLTFKKQKKMKNKKKENNLQRMGTLFLALSACSRLAAR